MSIRFIVETENYILAGEQYSRSGLLKELVELKSSPEITLTLVTREEFTPVYNYLTNGVIPKAEEFPIFYLFQIDTIHDYNLSCVLEQDMRANMYTTENPKYLEKGYGLVVLDELLWNSLSCRKNNVSLFEFQQLVKSPWDVVQEKLAKIRELLSIPGAFVAGGCLISILFGLPISDVDVFLFGLTEEEANETLLSFSTHLRRIYDYHSCTVTRTANAITFRLTTEEIEPVEIQVITRLYKTYSEVLHGFDLCASCVGLCEDGIIVTHRGLYALENACNTVSFSRLSPSYEYRLAMCLE
jgi:hypothetical protein